MFVLRHLIIVLAAALLIAAPAAEAAKKTKVPRGFASVMLDMGLEHDPPATVASQIELMRVNGVQSLRTVFNWDEMQPAPNGPFDFSRSDLIVREASLRRIEVVPVMLYAPPWARVFPREVASPPRTEPFRRFLRAAIARYGSRGSFWAQNPSVPRRPLRYWQVSNEPHFRVFWDAPPSSRFAWPHGYARLLRAAHRTIHRADKRAKTVMAGLFGASWTELRRIYRAGRTEGQFDVAAIHVYVQDQARVVESARRVRRELRRAGDGRKRLWITEFSFPSSLGRADPIANQRQETPAGMAKRLTATYLALARRRRALRLDRAYWYTWSSPYPSPRGSSNFDYSGLVARRGPFTFEPQPALEAFRRVAERLRRERF
jgi:hypothetical protein